MSLSTAQKRHLSLLCVVYMQPPGWIFCFDLQLKAIVEAKQEKHVQGGNVVNREPGKTGEKWKSRSKKSAFATFVASANCTVDLF